MAVGLVLVLSGRGRAEEVALGAGLGLSVAADGKNQGLGVGVLVAGEHALMRRSGFIAQAYGGALWTATRSGSCDPPCELSARLAFTGVKGRLQVVSRFIDAGLGVARGTMVTRGGTSRAVLSRGTHLHALFGLGVGVLDRFALSATYLWFPTANHLTGGLWLSYRMRTPPRPPPPPTDQEPPPLASAGACASCAPHTALGQSCTHPHRRASPTSQTPSPQAPCTHAYTRKGAFVHTGTLPSPYAASR